MSPVPTSLRDPWRRPWGLAAVTYGYLVWALVPLLVAILFAFNSSDSVTRFDGFSLRWWIGPRQAGGSLLHSASLRTSLKHSLLLAASAVVVVVPMGTLYALGTRHWGSRIARASETLILMAIALPPIILGSILWILLAYPLRHIPFGEFGWFGTRAQFVGLVSLELPFVAIILRARLLGIDLEQEDSAMDLGASPSHVIRRVVLPQLWLAIGAASAVAFSIGLGEFVVTNALRSTESTRTIGTEFFLALGEPSPIFNAVGALLAAVGVTALLVVLLAFRATGLARRLERG
jgi:spermidine/putrescine transport system permease protein